ncbi:MbtH family NRPS accessory protein [Nonomuraea sp. NPDC050404]|uniref:MbtH family protein n=1 Tax=Nonomuraea sp. NPDC050404 TaxID=3155783 RepID=UPI0033E5F494
MTTNPFDNPDAAFCVLVNDEEQHSIWPAWIPAPDGWSVGFSENTRAACVNYITAHWTDLRPRSLREFSVPGVTNNRRRAEALPPADAAPRADDASAASPPPSTAASAANSASQPASRTKIR